MTRRLLLSLLFLLLPLQAVFGAKPAATTVIVVRHAEKALDQGADPHLTEAGRARSKALAAVLADAPVDVVFATNFLRTQETAAPVAAGRKLEVQQLPNAPADAAGYAAALAKRIVGRYAGKAVVVIGHSNTVPAIVEALSGAKVSPIADDEYDRLYVITLTPGAKPSVIAAQYGH